jgi:hypothetical protein
MPTLLPANLQGVFWSRKVSSLDLQKDKVYIIHQVLMYGSLDQIKWLKSVYPDIEIKNVFVRYPQRIYTAPAFNFVKNYILSIPDSLPKEKYVKTLS